MKFLLTMTFLMTTSVFARTYESHDKVKCYYTAQQGGESEIAYVLEGRGESLHVVFPDYFHGNVRQNHDDCLENSGGGSVFTNSNKKVELCLGEGQQIGRLVPIEATVDHEDEETIYCDREILNLFNH